MTVEEMKAKMDDKFIAGSIKGLMIQEILEGVSEISGRNNKLKALQNNKPDVVKEVVRLILDKSIKMTSSAGEAKKIIDRNKKPTYTIDPSTALASIDSRMVLIKRFRQDSDQPYNTFQSEKMLMSLSSMFSEMDCQLLAGMFSKKMPYKGITVSLVNAAYGDFIVKRED